MPLICRVELDKKKGIVLTVENEDGKITQTVEMDGTSIITKNKGDKETSTITQKEDSITIKCKTFKIEAETITCESEKASLHKSKDTFDIQSAKDMMLKTDAKLAAKATKNAEMSGKNIKLSGQTNAEMSGTNAKVKGSSKAEIDGAQLAMAGKTKADLTGAIVNVKADGVLTVEGKQTSVKGLQLSVG